MLQSVDLGATVGICEWLPMPCRPSLETNSWTQVTSVTFKAAPSKKENQNCRKEQKTEGKVFETADDDWELGVKTKNYYIVDFSELQSELTIVLAFVQSMNMKNGNHAKQIDLLIQVFDEL